MKTEPTGDSFPFTSTFAIYFIKYSNYPSSTFAIPLLPPRSAGIHHAIKPSILVHDAKAVNRLFWIH